MPAPSTARRGPETLTTLSLMVLIAIEVFGVALSGGWALAGLFELGDEVGFVLMGVFGAFAAWLMLGFWRRAAATDPTR